tara:strand:+ start:2853 stop:3272 length:420 start_codon:yes stop_codon:yes gene_type:complete
MKIRKLLDRALKNTNSYFYSKLFRNNINPFYAKNKKGIIFTLYSSKFNLIEIGFVETQNMLKDKLFKEKFVLVDHRQGTLRELNLLKETLKNIGVIFIDDRFFKYKTSIFRHLIRLGWPIGKSFYKQKVVRKKLYLTAS